MPGTPWSESDLRATQANGWLRSARETVDGFLRDTLAPAVQRVVETRAAEQEKQDIAAFELPSFESLALWRKDEPQQQQPAPTPSGTPSAMPGERRTVEATIQDGRVTPPTSGGDWRSMPVQPTSGSHPEKQALVYQEARAAGLDDEGARILVAVTETEGGLTGAIGDEGQSHGPFQFYEGGQMPGFRAWLREQGIQGDPNQLVHDVRLATRYAASGYLGRAIAAGRAKGLSGADLATYVQENGQVSVDPWKTGQNYQRLYGGSAQSAQPQASVPRSPEMQTQPNTPAVTQGQTLAPIGVAPRNEPVEYQRQPDPKPQPAPMAGLPPGAPPIDPMLRDPVLRRLTDGSLYWTERQQSPDAPPRPMVYDPRQSSMNAVGAVSSSLPPAAGPAAGPPAGGGAGSLPPEVAARWRQQFGRDATPDEIAELMGVLM